MTLPDNALITKPPLTLRQWLERYLDARGIEINPTNGSKVVEEAQELVNAIADYRTNPTIESLYHVYHEMGDVILATAGVARGFDVALEDCVDLKIERDRGRGYKSSQDQQDTMEGTKY
jgi:NTP pyrophosphatase (non-canonical NTP hydrolase)